MPFFTFRQNNSGGSHTGPAITVIIEAKSGVEANELAQSKAGLYFNGCDSDIDCPCCGDRWYEVELGTGDKVPSIYGKPLSKELKNNLIISWATKSIPSFKVYYKNGKEKVFEYKVKKSKSKK